MPSLQKKNVTNLSTCPQNVVDVVGGGHLGVHVFSKSDCFRKRCLLSSQEFVAFDGVIFDGSEVQLHLRTMDY